MSNSDRKKKNQLELRYPNLNTRPVLQNWAADRSQPLELLSMRKLTVLRLVSFLFKCKLPSSHFLVVPLRTTGVRGNIPQGEFSLSRGEVTLLCGGLSSSAHPSYSTFTVEGWRATAVICWAWSWTDGAEFVCTGRKPVQAESLFWPRKEEHHTPVCHPDLGDAPAFPNTTTLFLLSGSWSPVFQVHVSWGFSEECKEDLETHLQLQHFKGRG